MMKPLLLLAAATALLAQTPAAFEVATVKPNTSGGGNTSMRAFPSGVLEYRNYPLRALIQLAYRVKDYAWSAPSWLESVRFDVVAKVPAGARPDQRPEMMQTLLKEQFQLAVHREEKEIPGFALVLDKKGLRISPVEPGDSSSGSGPGMVGGTKLSMPAFAGLLSNALQRPVKDRTETPGVYDIKIRWLPDGPAPADTTGLSGSVYEALQDLGLKLQVQKVMVETLVVDHAERTPAGN
jgi:uncharacterized protein (TIGR03435 family)